MVTAKCHCRCEARVQKTDSARPGEKAQKTGTSQKTCHLFDISILRLREFTDRNRLFQPPLILKNLTLILSGFREW